MSAPDPTWVELLLRVTVAAEERRGLDATDTRQLANAFMNAVAEAKPVERALGLPPQWRSQWRHLQRAACVQALVIRRGSVRSSADELHKALSRYRASPRFASDLAGRTRPAGDDWFLHATLRCNGCRVPSVGALRGWLKLPP